MTNKPVSLGISLKDAGLEGNTVIHDKDPLASDSGETGTTATPWRLDRRASTRVVAGRDDTVATTGCQGDLKNQWEANAAFIVRACNAHDDLVEALRSIADQLERVGDHRKDAPFIEGARAALAKAESR